MDKCRVIEYRIYMSIASIVPKSTTANFHIVTFLQEREVAAQFEIVEIFIEYLLGDGSRN